MAETVATTVRRVSHVTLIVRDQQGALDFYRRAFGVEVRADAEFDLEGHAMRWLTVGIPGDDLEWSLMPPVPGPDGRTPPVGDNNMTVLEVTDCDTATDAVRGAGGTVVSEPEEMPWGRSSVVRDPDGNPFNLVQPRRN